MVMRIGLMMVMKIVMWTVMRIEIRIGMRKIRAW